MRYAIAGQPLFDKMDPPFRDLKAIKRILIFARGGRKAPCLTQSTWALLLRKLNHKMEEIASRTKLRRSLIRIVEEMNADVEWFQCSLALLHPSIITETPSFPIDECMRYFVDQFRHFLWKFTLLIERSNQESTCKSQNPIRCLIILRRSLYSAYNYVIQQALHTQFPLLLSCHFRMTVKFFAIFSTSEYKLHYKFAKST